MRYKYMLDFNNCNIETIHDEIKSLNIIEWLEDKHNVILIPTEKGFALISEYQLEIEIRDDCVALRFRDRDDWDILTELDRLTLTLEK